jgi:hypothetical protein
VASQEEREYISSFLLQFHGCSLNTGNDFSMEALCDHFQFSCLHLFAVLYSCFVLDGRVFNRDILF